MLTIKEANEIAKFIAIGLPHYHHIKEKKAYILDVFEKYHLIEKQKENIQTFDWEEFKKNDRVVVYCKTEEEAKDFCKQMYNHGMDWRFDEENYLNDTSNGHQSKGYLNDTKWGYHEEGICYYSDGTHASKTYSKQTKCTILEWSDYIKPEKKENTRVMGKLKNQENEQFSSQKINENIDQSEKELTME